MAGFNPSQPRDHRGRWIHKDMGYTYGDVYLTAEEISALREYTGWDAGDINGSLRDGEDIEDWKEEINIVDSALNKQSLEETTIMYRGVRSHHGAWLNPLEPGDIIHQPGYTSTSVSIVKAAEFAGPDGFIQVVNAPKGLSAIDLTTVSFHEEHEILLPRSQRLEFTHKEDSRYYFDALPASHGQGDFFRGTSDDTTTAIDESIEPDPNVKVGGRTDAEWAAFMAED